MDGGEVLCVCLAWEDDVVLIWNPALAWVGVVSPKCCTPSFHLPTSHLPACWPHSSAANPHLGLVPRSWWVPCK